MAGASRRFSRALRSASLALTALAAQAVEEIVAGRAYVDGLVLAILLGIATRTFRAPAGVVEGGIKFVAKTLLEVAVMLLGATMSFQLIASVGVSILIGIVVVVALTLGVSYGLGRAIGLPWELALLVACGNAICGNSAIAAIAPVIGAKPQHVASSITFTALLGVIVVLGLPILVPLLGFDQIQYGVVAGLTVYAVPQVLAATAVVGQQSVQIGTFVKLVRVLLLGPLILCLSVTARHERDRRLDEAPVQPSPPRTLIPWFIIGFLVLMLLRSLGLVPTASLGALTWLTKALTILAMAALGLGVHARSVARAGGRVTLAATLSLAILIALAIVLVRVGGVT